MHAIGAILLQMLAWVLFHWGEPERAPHRRASHRRESCDFFYIIIGASAAKLAPHGRYILDFWI